MKSRTFLTPILITTALLSVLATQAIAQGRAGGGAGGVLTAEQKEAVKAALAKDADEKSVRPKIEAVTKIQTEIALLRLKAVKEIASTLTDEQKTQIETRPGVAYNALLGGFGAVGGGGGRRGAGAAGTQ